MTRRRRNSSSSYNFSAAYSDDNEYVDHSSDLSRSCHESDEDANENGFDDVGASDFHSESITNSHNDPKSNGSSAAAAYSNSVLDSPIWSKSNPTQQSGYSSYINIAPLPIFHGGPNECPLTHLSRFAKVCRANNASSEDMMLRIFPVTLENEAGIWYDFNIEPYPSLSWEEIKSSFLQAYQNTRVAEQLKHELMMINQENEECVRSYFLRLQRCLQTWPDHGIPEDLLKDVFVDGLKDDFRFWIIPQKPESLMEALRLAFAFEQVKSIKALRSRKNKDLKCGFCDGLHEEKDCQVKERLKEFWRKTKERSGMNCSSEKKNQSNEEEKFVGEILLDEKKKKSMCQCEKHHCWKRSNSLISRNSNAD